MVTVTIEEVRERLPDLLENVELGEEVLITKNAQPFARLMPASASEPVEAKQQPRQPGSARGQILYIADDFDAPLEDFKDYM